MTLDLDTHLPAIVAGDPEAFGRWVAGAEPTLRASLRKLARDVDAEAILQEGLLRIWQVAPRFAPDGNPNALLRLAHRVVHNLAISEVRRLHPTAEIDDRLIDLADPSAPPDPLLRRAIDECREKLPGK